MTGGRRCDKMGEKEDGSMVLLIAGETHTGKTALAQRLLERYHYPYLSIDLIKMGLIRSGQTELTPEGDEALTQYLWPIVRETVKTAIENGQNLIVEGVYIPFDWKKDFDEEYRREIRYVCLIMTEAYIRSRFGDIRGYAGVIEQRGEDDGLSEEALVQGHRHNLEMCRKYGCEYLLIDGEYRVDLVL